MSNKRNKKRKKELTKGKKCDNIYKSPKAASKNIAKLFKKTSEKGLTKEKRCDIIIKLHDGRQYFLRAIKQYLEN